jgi:hypothetical protein
MVIPFGVAIILQLAAYMAWVNVSFELIEASIKSKSKFPLFFALPCIPILLYVFLSEDFGNPSVLIIMTGQLVLWLGSLFLFNRKPKEATAPKQPPKAEK